MNAQETCSDATKGVLDRLSAALIVCLVVLCLLAGCTVRSGRWYAGQVLDVYDPEAVICVPVPQSPHRRCAVAGEIGRLLFAEREGGGK